MDEQDSAMMMQNTKAIENSKANLKQGSLGRDIVTAKVQELKSNFIMLGQNFKDEAKLVRDSVENDKELGRTHPDTQVKQTAEMKKKAAFIL